MSRPDTITVVAKASEEIEADAADIEVSIIGSSLFSGQEAFKKAQEVKALTSQLMEAGIDENRIKLRTVEVDSSSFALIKSSSAKYTIKIAKVALEAIPTVLGIIGSQKNCNMNMLEWIYNRQEEVRSNLRSQALEAAMAQAKKDAAILGVTILGIFQLTELTKPDDSFHGEYVLGSRGRSVKRKASAVELGFALGNATNVKISLQAEFRVTPMGT